MIGGTCDTVGIAGCWLSGCYGAFSKKFGNGALNMLAARVALANGSIVTASECSPGSILVPAVGAAVLGE